MSDNKLITALRCTKNKNSRCNICEYPLWFKAGGLDYCDKARLERDAADAIERLEAENAELKQYRQIAEAQDKKIDKMEAESAALRAQKGQPNKRLKPRILRKMMLFQWVWIEVLKPFNNRDKVSAYYSKHYDFTGNTAFCCGYPGITFCFDYADYGKTWLAYRCKPEQEANRND